MKNNSAVKRSRDKSKQKSQEAQTRVQMLQSENERLRSTVDNMTQELKYLKEMLICQAGSSEFLTPATEAEIDYLLREDTPTDLDRITNVLTEMRRIQNNQHPQHRGEEDIPESSYGYQHPHQNHGHY
jgi:predicted nuclease with TOPRIM domain